MFLLFTELSIKGRFTGKKRFKTGRRNIRSKSKTHGYLLF